MESCLYSSFPDIYDQASLPLFLCQIHQENYSDWGDPFVDRSIFSHKLSAHIYFLKSDKKGMGKKRIYVKTKSLLSENPAFDNPE